MRNYQVNAVKLQKPESKNHRIQHPRCIELLKREAYRPLIALVAPTGYGKTTLLGAWAHALPAAEAIGWLSLDTEDNELRRLLTHLIEALPQIEEVLRNTMLAKLDEEVPIGLQSPPQTLLNMMIQALNTQDVVHLFFDHYEAIQEAAVHNTFEYLITHSNKHVHYYFASREKLPFYTSIRSLHAGPMTISHDHLKLNPAEIKQFVHLRTRLQLQAPELQRLHHITEGWPLAINIFVSLLDGSRAQQLSANAAIDAIQPLVQDVFLDELLLRQPEELQQFMLRTSIPDFFDAEFSFILTENPSYSTLLEQLLHKNLFLSQDNNGQYRYHTLFAQFLRTRFKQLDNRGFLSLQERSSIWFEKNRFLLEAVQHALHIPDYDLASTLLMADIVATFSHPKQSLIQLLQQFPSMEISRRPSIAMIYAWFLVVEHRITAAESILHQAETEMTEKNYVFVPTGENLHGYFASIRSHIYFFRRDTVNGMIYLKETAVLLNGQGYVHSHANSIDPCGSSILKSNVGHWGAIEQSIAMCEYAELAWKGVNAGFGNVHTLLGECFYEQNQLPKAEKFLLSGRRIGLDLMDTGLILPTTLTLVQLMCTRGELQAAQILLQETRKLIDNKVGKNGIAVLDACQTRLNMKANQVSPVKKWLHIQPAVSDYELEMGQMYKYLTLLRVHTFLGQFRQGIAFGEKLLQYAQSWYLHYYIAEIYLLLAILYEGHGVRSTAFHKLERVLEIGHEEGYIQLFLDEWEIIEPLLNKYGKQLQLKQDATSQKICSFYDELFQYSSQKELATDKVNYALKHLTAKEHIVLQGLIARKSNASIAGEQSIGIETVKTHCRNIYKKLRLKSRKDVLRLFADDEE
jgi:LuxR family maltose regulon positive regulatory protein